MPIKVLHITAHLGGGVGRVLSSIVKYSIESNSDFEHTIVCLEHPIKSQNSNKILNCRGKLVIHPTIEQLNQLIEKSDIVQLEWWNHPSTVTCLSNPQISPMRLITWYHNSGLTPPFPKQLILNSHIFLFTTDASFENKKVKTLIPLHKDHLGVVHASGGFEDFPHPRDRSKEPLSIGYFGSLKKSKIHPRYGDYLSAIKIPNLRVKIIGDISNQENIDVVNTIKNQCSENPNLIEFTGFVQNPIHELDKLNVLAYILHPEHYGTTENALLEAMSMGLVPIVFNNSAERRIIDNYKTGVYVNSEFEFAEVIQWLHETPEERQKIGENAAKTVRERFSIENTYKKLNTYYEKVMEFDMRKINFEEIFNSCQNY